MDDFLWDLLFSVDRWESWIIDCEYKNEKDVWHSCDKWKNSRFDEFLGLGVLWCKK